MCVSIYYIWSKTSCRRNCEGILKYVRLNIAFVKKLTSVHLLLSCNTSEVPTTRDFTLIAIELASVTKNHYPNPNILQFRTAVTAAALARTRTASQCLKYACQICAYREYVRVVWFWVQCTVRKTPFNSEREIEGEGGW